MLKRKTAARDPAIPDAPRGLSRHGVLQTSGVTGLALAGLGTAGRVTAQAEVTGTPLPEYRKTICQFCSVGCSIWIEVENASGTGRSPPSKAQSTKARIAPWAPRCARSLWASGG